MGTTAASTLCATARQRDPPTVGAGTYVRCPCPQHREAMRDTADPATVARAAGVSPAVWAVPWDPSAESATLVQLDRKSCSTGPGVRRHSLVRVFRRMTR